MEKIKKDSNYYDIIRINIKKYRQLKNITQQQRDDLLVSIYEEQKQMKKEISRLGNEMAKTQEEVKNEKRFYY